MENSSPICANNMESFPSITTVGSITVTMDLNDIIIELRELNEPVPKPMRLPTSDEVDAAEVRLGVNFHPDYRKYLLEASDVVYGTIEPCTVTPDDSHTDLIKIAFAAWDKIGVPRHFLPVCEDNGDYYCINQMGEIIFWSPVVA